VIFAGLIGWGLLAASIGLISDIRILYAVRFALGIVESAVLPALIILLARWFTRAERARVTSILILGNPVTLIWMSVLSGYLADRLGWRMMFVAEGLPPILWAFVWWALVQDHPSEAAWVPADECARLERQLALEQRAIAPVRDLRAALTSPIALALSLQFFCWSAGLYGFVIWLPSILRNAGTGMVAVGWLTAVPYIAAAMCMIGASALSDRLLKRRSIVWPALLLGALAFTGSYLAGSNHFWLSFALLVAAGGGMYAAYGPFFAYIADVFPANVAGGATALVNSMGALGGFAGSYLVGLLNDWTGKPEISFISMAAMLGLASLITFFLPERRAA
jgi:MFS family permease